MLEETSPKLRHLSSSLAACLQPTAVDFVPYLDERSLFGTSSFIKEFNFDIKNAKTIRFVAGWHMVKFSWRLSTPEIHTVIVFLCDWHRNEM